MSNTLTHLDLTHFRYAVLAVNIFGAHESGVRFTSFTLAFLTLLGIATGEDWTEHVTNLTSQACV